MTRRIPTAESEISPTLVQDAIVQIMRSAVAHGRQVDLDMARDMAGRLAPAVQKMGFGSASSATLSGNAAFHSLVTQHLGSPVAAAYDPLFRRQLQQAIDKANLHGPDYLAGIRDGIRLGLRAAHQDRRASEATSGDGSSARFLKAGMVPGNADARGFMAADYNSPLGRAIMSMGVVGETYGYLRGEGFERKHIYDAAKDARALGFDVNNKRSMKNLSVIRKDGDDPEETMQRIKGFKEALEKDEAFRKAVEEHEAAKTPEDKEKVMERINKIAGEHATKHGIPADMEKQRKEAVRKAIGETTEEAKNKAIEKVRKTAPEAAPVDKKASAKAAGATPGTDAAARKALAAILSKNKLELKS